MLATRAARAMLGNAGSTANSANAPGANGAANANATGNVNCVLTSAFVQEGALRPCAIMGGF